MLRVYIREEDEEGMEVEGRVEKVIGGLFVLEVRLVFVLVTVVVVGRTCGEGGLRDSDSDRDRSC